MKQLLSKGDQGADVEHLRKALAKALGTDADAFAVLKQAGSSIDSEFDAAAGNRASASLPTASSGRAASCCLGWRRRCR